MSGKSVENQISNLRPYILCLMQQEGRDFAECELCGRTIPDSTYEIHHAKYDGATYRDLRIVCRSCNKLAENRLLD